MRRLLTVIPLAAIGLGAIGAAILYCCALHAQHEATAFLSALSDAQVGVTSRDEFMKLTARFKELESQSTGSDCRGEKCLTGPSLGFENSAFGKFILFLDNGQVWQQIEGDADRANFHKDPKDNKVTIERGLIGSYNLMVNDSTRTYKVERIK